MLLPPPGKGHLSIPLPQTSLCPCFFSAQNQLLVMCRADGLDGLLKPEGFSGPALLLTSRLPLHRPSLQEALQCMCGNTMSVPLLTDAATVSGAERETAAVRTPGPALWVVTGCRQCGKHGGGRMRRD